MTENTTPATTDTPAESPFQESHERGKHHAIWHFGKVNKPDGINFWHLQEAVCQSRLYEALKQRIKGSAPPNALTLEFTGIAIAIGAKRKEDFPLAQVIIHAVCSTHDPAAFRAEIEEALRLEVRRWDALKRAESLLNGAASARDAIHTEARKHADEALASEVAALKAQYEALAARYIQTCEEKTAQVLGDVQEFAEFGDDAALVVELTRALVGRKPFSFDGPRLHSVHLFMGTNSTSDPGYAAARDELIERLVQGK